MPTSQPSANNNTESPFSISSPLEIQAILRSIQKSKALLHMQAKGGTASILTAILEVDPTNNTLIVDDSSDDGLNRRITAAQTVVFETLLAKVRIQFTVTDIQASSHGGRTALKLDIPSLLIRLQRRENYRVDSPISQPATCTFFLQQEIEPGEREKKSLLIKDISVGGISVWDNEHVLDAGKSATYTGCRLELPNIGVVNADLRVVQTIDFADTGDKERRCIGFKFTSLSGRMETKVKKYIRILEQKLIAKRRGYE